MASRTAILATGLLAGGLALAAGIGGLTTTDRIQDALSALAESDPVRAEAVAAGVVGSERDGAWRAWMIVAAARQRQGRHRQALEAYRQFLALCRDPAERTYAMDRIRQCRMAFAPPPRPVPASKLLSRQRRAELAEVDSLQYTESTEHFVIRAYNASLAKLVGSQAEVALRRICRIILSGQDYPHAVNIYVWPDVAEYRKHAVSAAEWSGGSFTLRQDASGQTVRRIDLTQRDDGGGFDVVMLDRILPHELCHLVLAELFGAARCPLALNEGLAMMAEAEVDNSRVLLAGAAVAGDRKIALDRLLLMDRYKAENVAVFYAEAFSLTCFLHRRLTPEQFREMLAHIKGGCPLDEAVQRALYVPYDEAFLERLARSWENEAVRQSQFLKALHDEEDTAS